MTVSTDPALSTCITAEIHTARLQLVISGGTDRQGGQGLQLDTRDPGRQWV